MLPSSGRKEGRGSVTYDPKYVRFIVLFNVDRDYYACHDVMEELWLEEGRSPLWQGLLQVAVGLHHFGNHNYTGAVKLLRAALDKLERYGEFEAGIDLDRLRKDAAGVLAPIESWLAHGSDGPPPAFRPIAIDVLDRELADLVAADAALPRSDRECPDGDW